MKPAAASPHKAPNSSKGTEPAVDGSASPHLSRRVSDADPDLSGDTPRLSRPRRRAHQISPGKAEGPESPGSHQSNSAHQLPGNLPVRLEDTPRTARRSEQTLPQMHEQLNKSLLKEIGFHKFKMLLLPKELPDFVSHQKVPTGRTIAMPSEGDAFFQAKAKELLHGKTYAQPYHDKKTVEASNPRMCHFILEDVEFDIDVIAQWEKGRFFPFAQVEAYRVLKKAAVRRAINDFAPLAMELMGKSILEGFIVGILNTHEPELEQSFNELLQQRQTVQQQVSVFKPHEVLDYSVSLPLDHEKSDFPVNIVGPYRDIKEAAIDAALLSVGFASLMVMNPGECEAVIGEQWDAAVVAKLKDSFDELVAHAKKGYDPTRLWEDMSLLQARPDGKFWYDDFKSKLYVAYPSDNEDAVIACKLVFDALKVEGSAAAGAGEVLQAKAVLLGVQQRLRGSTELSATIALWGITAILPNSPSQVRPRSVSSASRVEPVEFRVQ